MSKNCLRSFCCNKEIVAIHLTLIQTSEGQNNCWSFVAMKTWKNTAAHEMKSMPSSAQTRSTEPHAGVLTHEKEELMVISSPQQDINDVDNVTDSCLEK